MCIYIYSYMHLDIYIYTYLHICKCVYIYIYYVHYIYIYVYYIYVLYIYMYIIYIIVIHNHIHYMIIRVYTYIHIYIYLYMYILGTYWICNEHVMIMGIFFGYAHIMMPNDDCQLPIRVEEITWMLLGLTPAKEFVN